jgi:hypothetical protein
MNRRRGKRKMPSIRLIGLTAFVRLVRRVLPGQQAPLLGVHSLGGYPAQQREKHRADPLHAQERPNRRQYRPILLRGGTNRSEPGMIQD